MPGSPLPTPFSHCDCADRRGHTGVVALRFLIKFLKLLTPAFFMQIQVLSVCTKFFAAAESQVRLCNGWRVLTVYSYFYK